MNKTRRKRSRKGVAGKPLTFLTLAEKIRGERSVLKFSPRRWEKKWVKRPGGLEKMYKTLKGYSGHSYLEDNLDPKSSRFYIDDFLEEYGDKNPYSFKEKTLRFKRGCPHGAGRGFFFVENVKNSEIK
jgi:hypothetical protein